MADKIIFVFCFTGGDDLESLRGGRGAFIFYSLDDYPVEQNRQGPHGLAEKVQEELA